MPIIVGPSAPSAPGERGTLYLPIVANGLSPMARCFDNPYALAFYHLLTADSRQQRPALACCPTLILSARQRAAGLAAGDPWGHVDARGRSANEYARDAGCHLPAHYAQHGNNVESLVAGSSDVQAVFDALANSPSHAAHLFGLNAFFLAQRQVGIAMMAGGFFGWYWVVHISECEPTSGE